MTPDQTLSELHKALAVDERLVQLLKAYATHYANTALRESYKTNEPALLIRQAGMAEGVEKFVKTITALQKPAQDDRHSQRATKD